MNDRKIHGENNVWSTAQERKRSNDFMLMLDLNEAIDRLSMANNLCWHGHVLMREDGQVLRTALDLEVESQREKGRLEGT